MFNNTADNMDYGSAANVKDKSMTNHFNIHSVGEAMTGIALGLAFGMLIGFPVEHNSLIGQAVTSWSSTFIVPPLDWVGINIFGLADPTQAAGISEVLTELGDKVMTFD